MTRLGSLERCLSHFHHPLDYSARRRRRGFGAGPGITVGGARFERQRQLPVAIMGTATSSWEHGAVDGDALRHSLPDIRRQQSIVLQRRAAPGARRQGAQPAGREPLDRSAHQRAGHRPRDDARSQGAEGIARSRRSPSSAGDPKREFRPVRNGSVSGSTAGRAGYDTTWLVRERAKKR